MLTTLDIKGKEQKQRKKKNNHGIVFVDNVIGVEGIEKLSDGLKLNTTLKSLDLSSKKIKESMLFTSNHQLDDSK